MSRSLTAAPFEHMLFLLQFATTRTHRSCSSCFTQDWNCLYLTYPRPAPDPLPFHTYSHSYLSQLCPQRMPSFPVKMKLPPFSKQLLRAATSSLRHTRLEVEDVHTIDNGSTELDDFCVVEKYALEGFCGTIELRYGAEVCCRHSPKASLGFRLCLAAVTDFDFNNRSNPPRPQCLSHATSHPSPCLPELLPTALLRALVPTPVVLPP